jgi:hypothetical protein
MRDQPRLLIVAVAGWLTILVSLLLSTVLYRLIGVSSVRLSPAWGNGWTPSCHRPAGRREPIALSTLILYHHWPKKLQLNTR